MLLMSFFEMSQKKLTKSFRFQKLFCIFVPLSKKEYETNSAEVRDKIFTRGT